MQSKENFPHAKPDRRHRAKARPEPSDRRQNPRYECNFTVRVFLGEGKDLKQFTAMANDISDGGILLEQIETAAAGTKVRIEFDMPESVMPEEFAHKRNRLEGTVRHLDREHGRAGIEFDESLSRKLGKKIWFSFRLAAVVGLFLVASLILLIKYENLYFFWFDVPVFAYSVAIGAYLISRFFFALFYHPPGKRDALPPVTVLVPAFNEELHIERTLVHVLESEYPADYIQVIGINDGSTDGTLEVMRSVQERYPELVVVDLEENRGKRFALAAGSRMATGEFVIFVDSDSFVYPDAIRKLMDGFHDERVAGVSGHCEVENLWTNLLTRMQAVRYYIGFRVIKAAESIFDSVTCLSGPLSAYRREPLMKVLDEWVNQEFWRQPATYGDDRSLTNFLLREHKILYDSRARTRTVVPDRYMIFFKQQMRWKRSWFRENVRASAFMWRKEPLMSLSFYLGFLLPMLGPAIVIRAIIYLPLFQYVSPVAYLTGILLMSGLMSGTYLFAKRSRLWIYGIPFCFFYMGVLVWQMPWAVVSFWVPKWGTRG